MPNFLGALQPVAPDGSGKLIGLPRVCGKGRCKDHADAMNQLKTLYKQEQPEHAAAVDNAQQCFGGVFVFDCSPYELMEKAADEESMRLIQNIYEEATELEPLEI